MHQTSHQGFAATTHVWGTCKNSINMDVLGYANIALADYSVHQSTCQVPVPQQLGIEPKLLTHLVTR